MQRLFLAVLLCVVLGPLPCLRAEPDDDSADDPPAVGRPENFNGAVGSFHVTTHAEPTTLQAEDPLTFTVTITATGPAREPPARLDLRKLREFTDAFYIENFPERDRSAERDW